MSTTTRQSAWLLLAVVVTLHVALSRLVPPSQTPLTKRSAPTLSSIADWYFATSPPLRPLVLAVLVAVLAFLFTFIGITASDFFCPNLSTVAVTLGLSESTAGVTFLAFGNGSPDVFSTFAAVQGGTFSLAVGELIGAASFITSIVVGSIALVRPFHVPRLAFVRDITFFTAAVVVLVLTLHDGKLTLAESASMVSLYVAYVLVVVIGNMLHRWRATPRSHHHAFHQAVRSHSQVRTLSASRPAAFHAPSSHSAAHYPLPADLATGPSADSSESSPTTLRPTRPSRSRSSTDASVATSGSHLSHTSSPHDYSSDTPRAAFSLLGAVEFRDVVNSLRKESLSPSAHGPEGDYFGPVRGRSFSKHYFHSPLAPTASRRQASHTTGDETAADSEPNPWSDQTGKPATPSVLPPSPRPDRPRVVIPPVAHTSSSLPPPAISVIDPTGREGPPTSPRLPDVKSPTMSKRANLRKVLAVLFPSLRAFKHKSYVGMILAILSAPAIFVLTITLPVVDDGREEGGLALPTADDEPLIEDNAQDRTSMEISEAGSAEGGDRALSPGIGEELHHLIEGGFSPLHSPLNHVAVHDNTYAETEDDALDFYPLLAAAQCVFGPSFCVYTMFSGTIYAQWLVLGTACAGLCGAAATLCLASDGSAPLWRLVRCIAGFVCSMVWIATIADHVVSVLQAVGEILGLSDAIIGLTIFAVGNSLADLVANVTVAQFAPAMAYAACFGGPMLNLLLGIGGSGTYSILTSRDHAPVHLDFSPTLYVSAAGLITVLLATAVAVPLNGFLIDRRWAAILLVAYAVLMIANIAVEIRTGRAQ